MNDRSSGAVESATLVKLAERAAWTVGILGLDFFARPVEPVSVVALSVMRNDSASPAVTLSLIRFLFTTLHLFRKPVGAGCRWSRY